MKVAVRVYRERQLYVNSRRSIGLGFGWSIAMDARSLGDKKTGRQSPHLKLADTHLLARAERQADSHSATIRVVQGL